jgi:protein phosphatase 1 regulatory subunit 10
MSEPETSRQYSQLPNHVAQTTQQSQPRQQQQPQYQHQQPTLSINPSYVLPSHFYSHSLQHQHSQSQVPTTLSPHVLHSPSTPITGALSSLYSPSTSTSTAAAPIVNLQARKDKFSADVRPFLQPNSFTGAGAVNSLVGHIDDFGSQDVDATTRLEILTKIRDNAGNHYFRAWLENAAAMDVTREWLKAGLTARSDNLLVETIMPLLHVSLIPLQRKFNLIIPPSDRG